jgi:hypothetical protein
MAGNSTRRGVVTAIGAPRPTSVRRARNDPDIGRKL